MSTSTSAAGPQYFVVSTPLSSSADWKPSFLAGILHYQYNLVRKHVADADQRRKLGLSAPVTRLPAKNAVALAQFVQSLEPYAYLEDGWDGPDSRGPSLLSLWRSVLDSYQLISVGLPAPSPKILHDGSLGVYWKGHGTYAAIDFEPDGVHVWTVTDGKAYKSGMWDSKGQVPEALRSAGADPKSKGSTGLLQGNIDG
jgi:hypothetical protein